MNDTSHHRGGLDYFPCRYGASKLLFRGPRRRMEGAYVAVLGGSETYGKFVANPFPALLEPALSLPVVNLGQMHAGIDAFAADPAVLKVCQRARATVVQILGAQNLANGFYRVHPRRNDRFLSATPLLQRLCRSIDFDDFIFTRQMLWSLREQAPGIFRLVVEELKCAWIDRMRDLLGRTGRNTVLLWIAGHPGADRDGLGAEPLFVDDGMIAAVRPLCAGLIRVSPGGAALAAGTEGMVFGPLDASEATDLAGPKVHAEIAASLAPALTGLL